MLNPVMTRKSVLACSANCPADNQARQQALFLYGTLWAIKNINLKKEKSCTKQG